MQAFYTNTSTALTGANTAQNINTDSRSIVVRKIIVGNPVSGGNIVLFNAPSQVANATTTIAYKHTFPTFSTTNTNGVTPVVVDFRAASTGAGSAEEDGIICANGGAIATDQTMQVTVLWDYAEGN